MKSYYQYFYLEVIHQMKLSTQFDTYKGRPIKTEAFCALPSGNTDMVGKKHKSNSIVLFVCRASCVKLCSCVLELRAGTRHVE